MREPAALAIFAYHWNDPFWPLLMARQQEIHTPPLALYYLQVGRHGNSRYGRSQTGGQV